MESPSLAPVPSSPPQQPVWSGSSSSSSEEGSSSSSSPSISTSLSSSPSSRASSGLSTPAVTTAHGSVPPPVSPLSLPPSSINSETSRDTDGSSLESMAHAPARTTGRTDVWDSLSQNGDYSRTEFVHENGTVLSSKDQHLDAGGKGEIRGEAGKHMLDGAAASGVQADVDGFVESPEPKDRLAGGLKLVEPLNTTVGDGLRLASEDNTSELVDNISNDARGRVTSPNASPQQQKVDNPPFSGGSTIESYAVEKEERGRQEDELGDQRIQGSLSDVATSKDDEPIVVRTPKHGRRSSLGGDVDVLIVTPSPSGFSIDEQAGRTIEESTGDSSYQLQAMSSAPIWNGSFQHEKLGNASEDLKTPSPHRRSPRDASPETPHQFHVSSPHAEREMLRTQSMPTRSVSEGYQGDLDSKYRSRTGREGHGTPQGSAKMSEGGDVRRKVAEKLSERKKKKLLKHIATIKLDGTVAFDVAGSTRFASELFGSDHEREEICLNGQPVQCDKLIRRLQIVMLIVGTRGDVQPFVAIGKRLQQYGHRVRLASHANYRDFVTSAGLEYYPLGGDPKILAGYMVKNKGFLPSGPSEISTQRRQMKQICYSLLPACVEPDGAAGKPFRAEAIIANPPAYGHVHVAEALKIPIHIFFTMPWTPTSQFPHPLARLNIKSPAAYRLSYQVVDLLIWWGIRSIINNFRKKKLKLKPINYLSGSQGSITNLPTGYIWSPHLVPKPRDWGPNIDVVGFCFLNQAKDYNPPDDLVKWLQSGEPPIYIGFGSLPVQDPDGMTATIVKALEKTHQRGLIDRGWGGIGSKLGENLPEFIYLIENIPHDWLFEQCAAVVHHGGAGTTAAGLRAACPTTIVPFFGDQPFWGDRVHEKGVGLAPIPVDHFSLERLVKAIEFMMQPEVKQRAVELAQGMENEQGVQGAVEAFHKHLPDMKEPIVPVPLPRTFSRRLAEAFNRVADCCSPRTER